MVVAEDALADGVDQFLIADAEKLPFSNLLDTLYLCGSDINLVVGPNFHAVVFFEEHQPYKHEDKGNECQYLDKVGHFYCILSHCSNSLMILFWLNSLRKAMVIFSSR